MRKHRTWWVALLGAGTLAACGTAVPAAADQDRGWPGIELSGSGHSLDGFTIGYLPEGLEGHSVNATSTTDREGNRNSEIAWVQGMNDPVGRVAVARSEAVQDLEDVRLDRFSHLGGEGLERLGEDEGFENGAYLSEDTGDLFWLEEPGVAVSTYLTPAKWDREQLELMAASVVPEGSAASAAHAEDTAGEPGNDGAAEEAPATPSEGTQEAEDAGTEGGDAAAGAGEQDAAEDTEATGTTGEEAEDAGSEGSAAEAGAEGPGDEEAPGNGGAAGSEGATDQTDGKDPATEGADRPEAAGEGAEGTGAEDRDTAGDTGAEDDGASGSEASGTGTEEGVTAAEEDRGTVEAGQEDTADGGLDVPTQDDGPETRADRTREGLPEPGRGDAPSEGAAFPRDTGTQEVSELHQCVVDHFAEHGAPGSGRGEEEPADGEHGRLAAAAWHHGSEEDKLRAVEECVADQKADGTADERPVGTVSELDAQARAALARTGEEAGPREQSVAPVGPEEWERIQEHLPWQVPSEGS